MTVRSGCGHIVVTRGADDAIDMLVRAFADPAVFVIVSTPTFVLTPISRSCRRAKIIEVRLGTDSISPPDLHRRVEAART